MNDQQKNIEKILDILFDQEIRPTEFVNAVPYILANLICDEIIDEEHLRDIYRVTLMIVAEYKKSGIGSKNFGKE